MDERAWVEIDPARAKTRSVKRHVQTGVGRDVDEAIWRAENNDEDSECVALCHVYHPEYRRPCILYLSNWDADLGVH